MNYNILVTGGAGYLGAVLVPELLQRGHRVTVLDNFMYGQPSLSQCCLHDNFEVVRGDCRDYHTLKSLVRQNDIFLPFAALVGAPLCDGDTVGAITTNRDAVGTLVKIVSHEQRVIVPNTNSGYGIGEKEKECTEETPLRPISLYGKLKVEAEQMVLERQNSISLRLATVFGASPRMRIDLLVNDFTYRAVNDRTVVIFEGHFKRNYIHVRDVAQAFIHCIENFESMKGEAYNVGLSDANLSKVELCQKIKEEVPRFIYLQAPVGEDPDKRDYIVSNAKIESTGWRPDVAIETGIRELVKLYRFLRNSKYSNV
ncbi:MAG: NAD(P)-dependent oxidoreductase [Desulfobacterales bacterium]|nr:MAG: NAD(P)-dependent oxidoreductase [Desulfobacterales bacterium]